MRWRRFLKGGVWLLALGLVGVLAAEECLYRATLARVPSLPPKPEVRAMPAAWPLMGWQTFERAPTPHVKAIWPGALSSTVLRAVLFKKLETPAGLGLAERVARHWLRRLEDEGHGRPRLPERLALAVWLTRHWSAEELLAFEAAHLFLGHGLTGMEAGATVMLGKEWARLDAAEVALLLAVSHAPRRMDPWCFPERVRQNRDWRLKRLHEAGGLTAEELEAALRAPLGLVARPAAWRACP